MVKTVSIGQSAAKFPLMKATNTKDYETVKSVYASRWTGIVLDRTKKQQTEAILTILIILDRMNRPIRNKVIKYLHERWTIPTESVNLDINSDWLVEFRDGKMFRDYNRNKSHDLKG